MHRQFALLLLLALGAWFGMGHAKAATGCAYNGSVWVCDTKPHAWTNASEQASSGSGDPSLVHYICQDGAATSTGTRVTDTGALFASELQCSGSGNWRTITNTAWQTDCAAGTPWNATSHTCEAPFDSQACLAHNSEAGFKDAPVSTRVGNSFCSGGCDFRPVPASSPQGVVSVGLPGGGVIASGKWEFTGNACASTAPVKTPTELVAHNDDPQACVPAGSGQTFCLKKDGEHCASASNGRQICWRPTETGEKTDNNILQKRNPGPDALPPKTPPPDGTTLTQTGTPVTTTTNITNTTNTTTTTTTTTTNYTTNTGTDAGGGAGTGEPGDGSGGTTGTCGDSDPTCAGGVGTGNGTLGRMGGAEGRTKAGVIGGFKARIQGSALGSAVGGFFTVQVGGGTCPTWTLPATEWTPSMVMDFWCLNAFGGVWAMIGACCLIAFGWLAFKWAMG